MNFRRIYKTAKLFTKKEYGKIIDDSKEYMEKKPDDFLSLHSISFAYAYIGKFDEGFEYLKNILPNISSDKFVEKCMRFYVYHEYNNKCYEKVIYRCSFFNSQKISELSRKKIDEIVLKSKALLLKI